MKQLYRCSCSLVVLAFLLFSYSSYSQILWSNPTGQTWLLGSNWTGGAVPGSTDIAQFNNNPTSATTGIGINMDTASGSVAVGALHLSTARTVGLIIGNSSLSTPGILTLNGDTIVGIPDVFIANLSSNASRLTIQNTQGSGSSTLGIVLRSVPGHIVTGAGTSTAAGNTVLLNVPISGASAIKLLGNGTWNASSGTGNNGGILRLAAANSFTGGFTVGNADGTSNGILQLDSTNAINNLSGNDIIVNSNSQLVLSAPSGSTYRLNNINLYLNGSGNNYTGTGKGALVNVTNSSFTWDGPVNLQSDALISVNGATTTSLTLTDNITGTGALVKYGIGNLVLSGSANAWTGGTVINFGKLTVSSSSSLSTGPLSMAQVVQNPVLILNNAVQTITLLNNSFVGASNNNTITLNGTRLIINQDSNSTYGGNSSTQYSIINGTGSVEKLGSGTLTITSTNNTFSGGLIISAGTLKLNPSNNTALTLNAKDTLNGGTISTEGITRGFTFNFGTLCLMDNSVLRLSSDTNNSLRFLRSDTLNWAAGKTLTIYNWIGGYNSTAGTKGRLFIGTTATGITAAQLAQIKFVDTYGNLFSAVALSTGEIVPRGAVITTTGFYGPYCNNTSNSVSVPFTVTGVHTGLFKAQLSGPTGIFPTDSTTNIIGSDTASPITAVIPLGTAAGTGYRIRVLNTRPVLIFGSNNGSNITITGAPSAGTISGPNFIATGAQGNFSATISGGTWRSSDTNIINIASSGASAAVAVARTSGTVRITYTVTGSCGTSASTFFNATSVPAPVITRISPDTGIYGSRVTITGTGFNSIASRNIVIFGTVQATVISASATSISVQTPINSKFGLVTVTDSITGFSAYSPKPFLPIYINSGLMTDTVNLLNPVAFNLGRYPVGIAAGDIDGDGKTDLITAVSDANNILIFQNTGTRGSISTSSLASPFILSTVTAPYYVKTADLDGDGKLDILVGSGSSSVTKISVFRNQSTAGTISFAARLDIPSGGNAPIDLSIADMDQDGKPDIIIANQYSAKVSIIKNNNTPGNLVLSSFGSAVSFTTGTFPFRMFSGDLDGDGKPDIAVSNFGSNTISVFRNNSVRGLINTSTLAGAVTLATGGGPAGVNGGDINGDGKTDLLVAASSVNNMTVYQNASSPGSLSFSSGIDYPTPSIPAEITLSDMDGDGKVDPVLSNYYGNNISVYLNRATTGSLTTSSLMPASNFSAGYNATGLVATDMDDDGKADVALINGYSGTLYLYKNYPLPDAGSISGPDTTCLGTSSTFTSTVGGGFWSVTNSSLATISTSGLLTSISVGTDTIVYFTVAQGDTNRAFHAVTILPGTLTSRITASSRQVCVGASMLFSDSTLGGLWSSSDTNVAYVNAVGVVIGRSIGTAIITYTLSSFCGASQDTFLLRVNSGSGFVPGPVTGPSNICAGALYSYTDTTLGGTWSTSNSSIATVSPTGEVIGIQGGNVTITYGFSGSCGTYSSTIPVHVDTVLFADSLYVPTSVCPGIPISLSVFGSAGGHWALTNSNARITPSGIITGLFSGLDTVTYTTSNACGIRIASKSFTINAPAAAGNITGPNNVCPGSSVIFRGVTPGGIWIKTNNNINMSLAGADTVKITGTTTGKDTILYVFVNICGTDTARKSLEVLPAPFAGTITGSASVCTGSSVTLRATVAGGSWSHQNASINLADSVVTGLAAGTDTIGYTVISLLGCGSAKTTKIINVYTAPAVSAISGPTQLCVGDSIVLTATDTGGTWSRTNPRLSIGSTTGKIKGLSGGLDTVKYTITRNGCSAIAIKEILVNPLPVVAPITGPNTLCEASTIILKDATTGGVWANTGHCSIFADSILTGTGGGTDTITYSVSNSCGTTIVGRKITVNPLPFAAPITGVHSLFAGDTILLKDTARGGTWLSRSNNVIVNASGFVGGLKPGFDTILYIISNNCGRDTAFFPLTIYAPNIAGTITDFRVFPNPGNGTFTVTLDSKINETISLLIADASFKAINLLPINTNEPTQVTLNLPNGTYLFSAVTIGRWFTIKVVIQR